MIITKIFTNISETKILNFYEPCQASPFPMSAMKLHAKTLMLALSNMYIPGKDIIAEKLAFSNAGHLTNKFTASVDMSPSKYREKHSKQQSEL